MNNFDLGNLSTIHILMKTVPNQKLNPAKYTTGYAFFLYSLFCQFHGVGIIQGKSQGKSYRRNAIWAKVG